MNKFRTCPIGHIFEHDGATLEVVESSHCNGCYFDDNCSNRDKSIAGECANSYRADGESIIYKQIEKPKEMTKDDLQTGMWVTTRNGNRYMVLRGEFTTLHFGNNELMFIYNGFMDGNNYNHDLTHYSYFNFDIIKIEAKISNGKVEIDGNTYAGSHLATIWERKEPIELTMEQIAEKFGIDVGDLKIVK